MVISFRLVSSTDHTSAITGATPTVTIDGSSVAGTITEQGAGYYSFSTTALSGPGPFTLQATAASADTAIVTFYASSDDYASPMFPDYKPFGCTFLLTSNMNPNIT